MILSIGAYSIFFGPAYAVGVVGQIFLHETGHAYAMHRLGIPFSPMVFIPFMGAVIALKEHPRDAYQDALIAAAGPIAGTLAAGVISIAGHWNGQSQLLISLADFGFMVNLFNLLPIGSM
jgi:Zn-dependent protease